MRCTKLAPAIREAAEADLPALSALARDTYGEAFGASMGEADLAHHLATHLSVGAFGAALPRDTILIAAADGEPAGFVQFGPLLSDLADCGPAAGGAAGFDWAGARELRRLYVRDSFRNRGCGARLMDAALAHPGLLGATAIYLDVWERNAGAIRFYRRYGFRAVGRRRFAVASGAETDFDLIMVRAPGG